MTKRRFFGRIGRLWINHLNIKEMSVIGELSITLLRIDHVRDRLVL